MVHDTKEPAAISPLAGKPAPLSILVDLGRLERAYYERKPEMDDPAQRVSFGTSGHRGSPFHGSFTEAHIAAITQAICDYRRSQRIDGPLYMGKDTHALSEPAQRTALEVLAANGVETIIQRDGGVTPTPVISWAILVYNRGRTAHLADLVSYLDADDKLRALYAEPDAWARKAILNVAGSGKFSADRTIAEYAADIWNVEPCPV